MVSPSLSLNTGQYSGKIAALRQMDGLLAGVTVYAQGSCYSEFHYHENPHLSLLLLGGNIYNSRTQSHEKVAGDTLFYHSGEVHRTLPGTALSKSINLEVESAFLAQHGISEQQLYQSAVSGPDNKFLILKMYKELLLNDALTHTSLQVLFLGMVAQSAKAVSKTPPWFLRLLELLRDQWNTNPTLESLSQALQVHPVTISKYFTKYAGCTLGEYLRKIKIDHSIPLIRNPECSLTEVALECGFADQSHFIRNFKAYTGLLPKEFQRL